MWVIEVNIAGYRFTREMPDLRPIDAPIIPIQPARPALADRAALARGMKPADSLAAKRGGTRNKMLVSAAEVMRERGAAGVTIDAVLARSGAPRGSVYYHFPDGRNQILTEALRYAGDAITATIDNAVERGARALLREYVDFWENLLLDCGFAAGCPVVAVAIGSAEDELALATEAGVILGRWCTSLTQAFVAEGFDETEAASLAVMSIAAMEGAIVLCRSTHSIGPLREVAEQLEFLIKAREFVRRNGLTSGTKTGASAGHTG